MKLKKLALATMFTVGAVSAAYAEDITQSITLVPNSTIEGAYSAGWGATHQQAGSFTDTFTLDGATGGFFESVVASISSMASTNIAFSSVTVNGNEFSLSSPDANGGAGAIQLASLNSTQFTGPLEMVVNGTAGAGLDDGSGIAASYGAMANVSPVPELETLAMMLAGLGVLGTVGRRRMKG